MAGILLSMLILSIFQKLTFFILMTSVAFTSQWLFLLLPNVKKVAKSKDQDSLVEDAITIKQAVKNFFNIFKISELKFFTPVMGIPGIAVALYAGFLHVVIERAMEVEGKTADEQEINQKTTIILFVLSFSEIVGGIVMGKIADMYSQASYLLTQITVNITVLGFALIVLAYYLRSYALCFGVAILLGCAENFTNCICSVIITDDYNG